MRRKAVEALPSGPQQVWNLDLKPGLYPIREAINLDRPNGPALFLEDGRAFWLKVRPQLLQQVRQLYTERVGNLFRSPEQAYDLEVREFDPQRHRFVVGLSPRESAPARQPSAMSTLEGLLKQLGQRQREALPPPPAPPAPAPPPAAAAVELPAPAPLRVWQAPPAPAPPPPAPAAPAPVEPAIWPAPPAPAVELEPDEDPVRRPDGSWRWRGALFSTREETMLGKALMEQGAAAVSSNSSVLLQECRRLHRKPDLLVFHNVGGRLICGIAEVDGSSHDGRWVADQERHQELQRAGFLAVRHYRAEQVFNDPVAAAVDFLRFLESFAALGQPTHFQGFAS